MESLNLSGAEPRSDGRLKSLFWPSIQNGTDVDYLGSQGFWVCAVVAAMSAVFLFVTGHPILAALAFLFFYVGGMGVREGSWVAALMVFLTYAADMLVQPGIIRILIGALLLSNLRATWIASHWKPESEEAAAFPPRFNDSLTDKIADQWPRKLWPKLRIPYYVVGPLYVLMEFVGVIAVRSGIVK